MSWSVVGQLEKEVLVDRHGDGVTRSADLEGNEIVEK